MYFFFHVCLSVLAASFSSFYIYIYIGIILRVKNLYEPKGASLILIIFPLRFGVRIISSFHKQINRSLSFYNPCLMEFTLNVGDSDSFMRRPVVF